MSRPVVQKIHWPNVVKWTVPFGLIFVLIAALAAGDAFLPLVPREPARQITEVFLRLIGGYMAAVPILPLVLFLAGWRIVRRRRRGLASPWTVRVALMCGSGLAAILACELAAAAWLAWTHRMPLLPTQFAKASQTGEISLVVLGGSTALGYPYDPKVSVGQIVAWRIEQALPGTKVLIDMRAQLGQNLEDMHGALAHLTRRPDAILVDSGHNEFLSRFATSRDAGYAEAPAGAFLRRLYEASLHSPLCLLVYETVRKHRLGGPPPTVNQHHPIDPPMFTPSEHHEILSSFRRRLDAIVSHAERIGAVAILMIPPANESGFEPNRTVLPERVSTEDRARLTELFLAARAIERDDPPRAVAAYVQLLAAEPEFAEAHFRLARLLERTGAYDEARGHYIAARDLDGFPVRCRTEFAQIYRDVAARHGCILINGPEVLRARTTHGILDDSLFHDAHHHTLSTHLTLAEAIVAALTSRGCFGLGTQAAREEPADLAACAQRFKLDSRLWATVCARSGTYYRNLAPARYDPAERDAKHVRYMDAARDLESGRATAEQVGIPGVGIVPWGSPPWDWWTPSR